ncbi:hypothetical protein RJ639_009127 [Escallonia herrerae]|uniref:CoA carboxyltransferase N-terminal domain-containing protein n=1 Tax=Escallonia herrerae TaxID=1293975 RepID=A0AA88VSW5_9ASTE|nr:hypothetical protein RJ639_009127 [Escallonia herrerae]
MNICEQCGYHLKMSSSDRIELSINPVSLDPIEFHSEEEPYKDCIDSYQRKTGLTEAVQTGIGQLNSIPVAIGVMDFQFMGVCALGGGGGGTHVRRKLAKISFAIYDYQSNKKLFYVTILTSPTTGGVTASFGMLEDIVIVEPNAYLHLRVIPEGSQAAEYLFQKGLFDLIVPRNLLKSVLSELFQLHAFFPLNQNSITIK